MSSRLAAGHFERAGMEREIRACDFLLRVITEERIRLAVDLNELSLMRQLLTGRRTGGRTCGRKPFVTRTGWGRTRSWI